MYLLISLTPLHIAKILLWFLPKNVLYSSIFTTHFFNYLFSAFLSLSSSRLTSGNLVVRSFFPKTYRAYLSLLIGIRIVKKSE